MGSSKLRTQTILQSAAAGTVASAALSLITSLTVSESSQIAYLVGCTGTIMGGIVGVGVSILDRLDELDRKRVEGAQLRALVEMPDAEQEIVRTTLHLKQVCDTASTFSPLFWDCAVAALRETVNRTSLLASGRFSCLSRQEIYYVKEALKVTRRAVCAVAARGPAWWLRPEADAYWTVYAEATRRGISVTRVFLVDDLQDPKMTAVLDRHAALAMTTLAIPRASVPESLRSPIAVFDDGLLHRSFMGRSVDEGHEVEFTTDSAAIRRARDDFDVILSLNETFQWNGATR